jgi:glycine/D-amino acid oxidase-like deaminating enzyme
MDNRTAIVIGAGIVGLATARALTRKGYSVIVVEKSGRAVGASIRNFGMIWPMVSRMDCCMKALRAEYLETTM